MKHNKDNLPALRPLPDPWNLRGRNARLYGNSQTSRETAKTAKRPRATIAQALDKSQRTISKYENGEFRVPREFTRLMYDLLESIKIYSALMRVRRERS